jgi:HD-GYP domain-containing protein (c-di-GMP phosphodiesterase class II)
MYIEALRRPTIIAAECLRMIRVHDAQTAAHNIRTQRLALKLATEIGVDKFTFHVLRLGSLIHDIGKLSIDAAIINKPGPLDERERKIVER